MTRWPSAEQRNNALKYLGLAALASFIALTLSGYFLLWSLRLSPYEASPVTMPRYAYYYWENPAVRRRILVASSGALLLVGGAALLFLRPRKPKLHGEARWASAREMRKAGLFSDNGILLGRYKDRYLVSPGQTGVILAAPPRSGKGVSCVVPNLLNWRGSVLVLDVKKENHALTAGHRSLIGEVYLFDPFAADGRTARWNPLTYVSENPHLRIDDIQRIAANFCPESPGSDPFWVNSARSLFVGIALYLFERRDYERAYNADPEHQEKMPVVPVTLGEILRQAVASDEEGFSTHWKRIIEGWAALGKPLSPTCVSLIMDVVDLAPQTASSVRKTFTSTLDLWRNPLLDMATSESDFDLRDLRKKKMTIYLGIKPRDFDRLAIVMNAFFQQAIGEQAAELPEHNRALKHQLLVVLDEFTAIGRIPILLRSMAFVPGYNVRVLIVIQTPSQLLDLYGKHGAATMMETLKVRIVFPPSNAEDAHAISNELGYKTVAGISRTIPAMGVGVARAPSVSMSDQRRALLLPQEIKLLPEDQQILLIEHLHAIRCHKIRYFEDKLFKKRLLPAPEVPKHDFSKFHGGRLDDHFALWQQREPHPPDPEREPDPEVEPVDTPEIDEPNEIEAAEPEPYRPIPPELAPEREFELDFTHVTIPAGQYATLGQLKRDVDGFSKELGL